MNRLMGWETPAPAKAPAPAPPPPPGPSHSTVAGMTEQHGTLASPENLARQRDILRQPVQRELDRKFLRSVRQTPNPYLARHILEYLYLRSRDILADEVDDIIREQREAMDYWDNKQLDARITQLDSSGVSSRPSEPYFPVNIEPIGLTDAQNIVQMRGIVTFFVPPDAIGRLRLVLSRQRRRQRSVKDLRLQALRQFLVKYPPEIAWMWSMYLRRLALIWVRECRRRGGVKAGTPVREGKFEATRAIIQGIAGNALAEKNLVGLILPFVYTEATQSQKRKADAEEAAAARAEQDAEEESEEEREEEGKKWKFQSDDMEEERRKRQRRDESPPPGGGGSGSGLAGPQLVEGLA